MSVNREYEPANAPGSSHAAPLNATCYVDSRMERAEIVPFTGGRAGIYSARCPGAEGPNEDAAALLPFSEDAGVLVVADGMGGNPAGEKASALAVREMRKAIEQAARTEALLRTAILDGFENANRAVLDLGNGAATTLAVVEVQGTSVRPYHVGDSVILITGNRGRIKHQTVAHSPIGYGVEAGLLDEAEAMHHEDRHLVSNMLGSPTMHIDIGPLIHLAPRDTVLLATDGLADNLHMHEIVDHVRKGRLPKALLSLARTAHQRMTEPLEGRPSKPDDVTFLGFRKRRQD